MRDKNTSARLCAKNAGGLMREGGHTCGTLWYNNNEGRRISFIVLQKLPFFKMTTSIRQYFSPTMRLPSRKDTGIGAVATHKANGGMKDVLEKKPVNRALRRGKDIPTSLTPTELRSADT